MPIAVRRGRTQNVHFLRFPPFVHSLMWYLPMRGNMSKSYEQLKAEVQRLRDEGRIDASPSREQRIDWAYGTTAIENDDVTREMAERAVDRKPSTTAG